MTSTPNVPEDGDQDDEQEQPAALQIKEALCRNETNTCYINSPEVTLSF